ncbi:MAG: hypothetical protein ACRDTE_07050 [Pseudonocardiaceae bacterium]
MNADNHDAGSGRDEHETGKPWTPDIATLEWAFRQVDTTSLAQSIRADVERRMQAEGEDTEFWTAVSDAAVEAIFWPLLRGRRTGE